MACFGFMLPFILLYTAKLFYWRSSLPWFLALLSSVLPEIFLGILIDDSDSVNLCTFYSFCLFYTSVFLFEQRVPSLEPGSVLFLLWWPLIQSIRNVLTLPTGHFSNLFAFIHSQYHSHNYLLIETLSLQSSPHSMPPARVLSKVKL